MVQENFAFITDAQTASLMVILTSRADIAPSPRVSAAAAVRYGEALARDHAVLLAEIAE